MGIKANDGCVEMFLHFILLTQIGDSGMVQDVNEAFKFVPDMFVLYCSKTICSIFGLKWHFRFTEQEQIEEDDGSGSVEDNGDDTWDHNVEDDLLRTEDRDDVPKAEGQPANDGEIKEDDKPERDEGAEEIHLRFGETLKEPNEMLQRAWWDVQREKAEQSSIKLWSIKQSMSPRNDSEGEHGPHDDYSNFSNFKIKTFVQ